MHYRFEQHLILHVFDQLMRLYIELEFLTSHSVTNQTLQFFILLLNVNEWNWTEKH